MIVTRVSPKNNYNHMTGSYFSLTSWMSLTRLNNYIIFIDLAKELNVSPVESSSDIQIN